MPKHVGYILVPAEYFFLCLFFLLVSSSSGTTGVYKLRPGLLRVRVFAASRGKFSDLTFVHQATEDEPNGCSVESGPRHPWLDVRLWRCSVGQIKRELAKIQIHRLPHYVTLHYITQHKFSSC
jgi:hypothetical protein